MRWSSHIVTSEKAKESVLDFVPKIFDLGTPVQALDYLDLKKKGSDFVMGDVLRGQTGVEQIEEASQESKIEKKALEKLKEIQESAYNEGFDLGREEGKVEAYNSVYQELTQKLDSLDHLLVAIGNLKTEMLSQNEAHLVKLVFQFASCLATEHLKVHENTIVNVLREAVSLSQGEENVFVRVSPDQFKFIEELRTYSDREFEFLKKIKLEPDDTVTSGGCIVETNYGEVDARIEQRINQLWNVLGDQVPNVKNKLVG